MYSETYYQPGSRYKFSNRFHPIRLVLTLIVATPVVGALGTLYGFIGLLMPFMVFSLLVFIFGWISESTLINWFFNQSESRNPTINFWTIALLGAYFCYCSYVPFLYPTISKIDPLAGIYFHFTLSDLMNFAFQDGFIWSASRVLEFLALTFLPAFAYEGGQTFYCEKCKQYLDRQEQLFAGETQLSGTERMQGNLSPYFQNLQWIDKASFQQIRENIPIVKVEIQACDTCELTVVNIEEGETKPGNKETDETTFSKNNELTDRLIVDTTTREYLLGG